MGCAGSKSEFRHTEQPNCKDSVPKITKKESERDDEEVQIVQQGKNLKNSALDELTEKNISISKTHGKSIVSIDLSRTTDTQNHLDKEKHSMTLYVEKGKNEEIENIKEKNKVNESTETPSLKSKTVKVEFEKHPHEFDFSFIEDEEKANKEEDLLTDQVLKEISEIN